MRAHRTLQQMSRISLGWKMAGASWRVIRSQPSLASFPLLAVASMAVYVLLIVTPVGVVGALTVGEQTDLVYWVVVALALFGSNVVATFFGVATIANAAAVLRGEDPTVSDGLRHAWSRKSVILQWGLLAATVGLALRILAERLGPIAGLVVSLLGGLAWAVASFFAVPIIALEGLGPWATVKRSTGVVRERWGESLVGNITIGIVTALGLLAGGAAVALSIVIGVAVSWAIGIPLLVVAVLAMLAVLVVGQVVDAVFRLVVFQYATTGTVVEGFAADDLEQVFRPRKRRMGI